MVDQKNESADTAFLMTVADEIEADVVESKLRQFDIPIMKRFREAGAYVNIYMGRTNFGIDLYVPVKSLEIAKEIIEQKTEEAENGESGESMDAAEAVEEEAEEAAYMRKRRIFTWIAIIFLVPGIFWFVLYYILNLFHFR